LNIKNKDAQVNNITNGNTNGYNGVPIDTLILTDNEKSALVSITNLRSFRLLYRATRDGFFADVFHSKCDNINPTLTLIRSNLNSVFGGYTNIQWNWCTSCSVSDSTAYIFSLRRRGFNSTERFPSISCCNHVYTYSTWGPTFGGGYDIRINDNSDIVSSSSWCSTYSCPTTTGFLAGSSSFLTTEIEVYHVA
jgi:hypothetical protein